MRDASYTTNYRARPMKRRYGTKVVTAPFCISSPMNYGDPLVDGNSCTNFFDPPFFLCLKFHMKIFQIYLLAYVAA